MLPVIGLMEDRVQKQQLTRGDKVTPSWMVVAATEEGTAEAATDGMVMERVESRSTKIQEISTGQPPQVQAP